MAGLGLGRPIVVGENWQSPFQTYILRDLEAGEFLFQFACRSGKTVDLVLDGASEQSRVVEGESVWPDVLGIFTPPGQISR